MFFKINIHKKKCLVYFPAAIGIYAMYIIH